MKVILLQDEKKLGKKGDVVEVSEGYARNYVLPKKIGVEATSKNLNDLKLQKANADKVALEQLNDAKALAGVLAGKNRRSEDESRRRRQSLRFRFFQRNRSRMQGTARH